MTKELKVDQDAFDRALRKLAHSKPMRQNQIKVEAKKPATILLPPIPPESEPRK